MRKTFLFLCAFLLSSCGLSNDPFMQPNTNYHWRQNVNLSGTPKAPKVDDDYTNIKETSRAQVKSFSVDVANHLKTNDKASAITKAKSIIADSLKDPNSAQFRNVRVVPYEEGAVICGEVNAKNSYGGYVGFEAFVASTNSFAFERNYSEGRYPELDRASNIGLYEACY